MKSQEADQLQAIRAKHGEATKCLATLQDRKETVMREAQEQDEMKIKKATRGVRGGDRKGGKQRQRNEGEDDDSKGQVRRTESKYSTNW